MKSTPAGNGFIKVQGTELLAGDTREQYRQKLARITLDSMVQFVGLLDAQGTVLEINQAALDAVGIKLAEVEGKPFWTTCWWQVSEEIGTILRESIARASQGEFVRWETEIYGRAGGKETIMIDASLSPVKDEQGKVVFITMEGRDITDLEKRVEIRTASLNQAIAQLEEFAYTVSHDLRAPLYRMQAYSDLLLKDCAELLAPKPEAIQYFKRIADNATRLDRMVRDVLTYSRMSRSELHLERVSTDTLVRDLVQHHPEMLPPKSEIQIAPLADVLGSMPLLVQALSNVLTNAIRFVAPGTVPRIRVWTEKRDRDVRIWIEDNGIGIDPRFQHRLFRMFERIHPNFSHEGGGVGLAIVRKATERMNGQVGVESDGANGSRFWIQLPEP